ncbi:putative trans-2-enoyl-CoA reductase, mitochondrial [Capsicum annuum]|nr:putative trans-2-enoyl-CoA reductase, mitochondrial [Capsicum annuum]
MATARIVHGISPFSRFLHLHLHLRRRTLTSAVRPYFAATSPPSTAVIYDQHGSPDVVTRVTELPPVEIKDNDVCVRMLAAPINPSDINRIEECQGDLERAWCESKGRRHGEDRVRCSMSASCHFELQVESKDSGLKPRIEGCPTRVKQRPSAHAQGDVKLEDRTVHAIAMLRSRRGTRVYPVRPPIPAVGGYEGVGEVHTIGSAVKGLSPGDWVIPSPPSSGTWQTYVVKEQTMWQKVDKSTPMEYAATIIVNPLTALRMLEDFVALKSGDTIVQNGATSIVGQCVIQLARLRGIHSINIIRDRVGSDEAKENLKQLGADEVYTESQLDVKNVRGLLSYVVPVAGGRWQVSRGISRGARKLARTPRLSGKNGTEGGNIPEPILGFNCVGGNAASLILKFLKQGGTMVTYGGMSKKPITVSTSSFIFKASLSIILSCSSCEEHTLKGFWLQRWMSSDKTEERQSMIDYLLGLCRDGKLKYEYNLSTLSLDVRIPPLEMAPFDDFHTALEKAMGKRGRQPKQVLKF